MQQRKAVVFGAGNLALGLLVDIINDAGVKITILHRENPDSTRREIYNHLSNDLEYTLITNGKKRSEKIIKNFEFYTYSPQDISTSNPAIKAINDPKTFLVVTAVKPDNLGGIGSVVYNGVLERMKNGVEDKLLVIACENMPNNSSYLKKCVMEKANGNKKVLEYIKNNVYFCNTVVDRICQKPYIKDNKVFVKAETHREWIVEEHPRMSMLHNPLRDFIKYVDKNFFKVYEKRKFWCFNGIHLAVAAFSYNQYENIPEGLNNPIIFKDVQDVQKEFADALHLFAESVGVFDDEFSITSIEKYNEEVISRIRKSSDDKVERILHDLLKVSEAERDIDKLVKKIKETDKDQSRKQMADFIDTLKIGSFTRKLKERIFEPIDILMTHNDKNMNMDGKRERYYNSIILLKKIIDIITDVEGGILE